MKSRNSLARLKQFQLQEHESRVLQIQSMLQDLEHVVADLTQQIDEEQVRAGIFDVNHYAYPPFAKSAAQRRKNLLASIQDLKEQLAKADEKSKVMQQDLKCLDSVLHDRSKLQSSSMPLGSSSSSEGFSSPE